MEYSNLLVGEQDGIITLTFNRPEKLNALNTETLLELNDFLDAVKSKQGLKGIIITGSGEKAFIAGADISEFKGLSTDEAKNLAKRGHDIFNKIENMHVPVIAAVNGFALGGGCELSMACHLRIGAPNAKFGQPEVNLGIIPGYGGTQRLIQYIGKGKALELLMAADMIDANTALQLGLLNHVVEKEELLPKAASIIEKIATKGPKAIGKVIACANAYFKEGVDGFQMEIDQFGDCFTDSSEVEEGTTAFLEKRKANFVR